MRRIAILAVSCWVLLAAASAQDAVRVSSPSNVLTRYLDRANIHTPVRLGRLTVFPIVLATEKKLHGVLTMDQALAKKLLVIEELKDAQVSKARFRNKSAEKMIFLMAGEVITGGKQNRTLTTDALLGPKSAVVLPLYCVQRGRWQGAAGFGGATTVAPQAVRARAAGKAGQKEVWDEVARANRRLDSSTSSDDLAAAMNKPENVERLAKLRRPIVQKLPTGCVGVVVARGGRIVGTDMFNSTELFTAMREKVLNSYLSQYQSDAKDEPEAGVRRPDQNDVRAYLQACYVARFEASDMRGVGQIYELSGARYGQTLAYTKAYGISPPGHVAKVNWMVHTALMERVVPVKPMPMPVPLPIRPPMPPEPQPRPGR